MSHPRLILVHPCRLIALSLTHTHGMSTQHSLVLIHSQHRTSNLPLPLLLPTNNLETRRPDIPLLSRRHSRTSFLRNLTPSTTTRALRFRTIDHSSGSTGARSRLDDTFIGQLSSADELFGNSSAI